MGRFILSILIGFSLMGCGPTGAAGPLEGFTAYTEESPPFNFFQDGKVTGIVAEMLEASCAEAQLYCPIVLVPWARAYHNALSQPNTLAFTATRTPDREDKFLWVGPVMPRDIWFYIRENSDLALKSVADVKRLKVGVTYGDALVWEMKNAGIPESALDMAPSFDANVLKLLGGHIDVMPATDIGMIWALRTLGRDQGAVRKALFFGNGWGSYLAVNPGSDPGLVERLRQGWAKIADSPLRAQLIEKYARGLNSAAHRGN